MKIKLSLFLLLVSLLSFGQTFVSTTPENKNVVLEQFTGIYCGFCPDGHVIAEGLQASNPNDIFISKIHTGGYANPNGPSDPNFSTIYGASMRNASGLAGYPAGTINRRNFSPYGISPQGNPGTTALSRGDWAAASAVIMSESSYVNIAAQATYDMGTGILTVNTETYYTASTTDLNTIHVAVIQNNTPGPQSGAQNYNPGAIISGPWSPTYNHQQMFRHLMDGANGINLSTTTSGTFVPNTHTWNVPTTLSSTEFSTGFLPNLDPTNFEVIAFVGIGTGEIITGYITPVNVIYPNAYDIIVTGSSAEDVICATETEISVTFRNFGSQNLTSCDFTYDVNGGSSQTYNWTGNMQSGATETITISNVLFTPQATNTLSISASNPNGQTDQNLSNNSSSANFIHFDQNGQVVSGISSGNISIDILTDGFGSETTWEIVGEDGTIFGSGGPYSNNTTYNHQVYVPANECFEFILYDSYGDGMCCANGVGTCLVTDVNGVIIFEGDPNNLQNFTELNSPFSTTPTGPTWECTPFGCVNSGTLTGVYYSQFECESDFTTGCFIPFPGCLDSLACNYDSLANINDGSCSYSSNDTLTLSACDSYAWDSGNYDVTGIYTNYYLSSGGCDSIVTLNLTINSSTLGSSSISSCANYIWNGTTYSSSGQYNWTGSNSNGCDSIHTLTLTINDTSLVNISSDACDNYIWDGVTYTNTGLYTNVYTGQNGCDSSVTLDLTINNSSILTVSVTNCDSYTWDGVTYDFTGSYTNSYTDLNGCDSIVTLDLIINQATTSLTLDSALGSYVWNGNTYSSSGTYTANLTNSLGCDSIATLELVIFANTWDCVSGACIDPGNGQGTYASLSACQSNCVLPTWDCVGGSCIDPGNGLGTYASLSACQSNCVLPTWDCIGGVCIDPGTGLGTFSSLSACQSNCVITATWDCVGGSCIDPGTGLGSYASLTACQANCTNTSLELNMINDFNIYPNPNEGIFRVSFSANSTDLIELRVVSPLGEDIFFDQLSSFQGEYDKKINLSNYAKGVYFMSINSGSELIVKKIIIN